MLARRGGRRAPDSARNSNLSPAPSGAAGSPTARRVPSSRLAVAVRQPPEGQGCKRRRSPRPPGLPRAAIPARPGGKEATGRGRRGAHLRRRGALGAGRRRGGGGGHVVQRRRRAAPSRNSALPSPPCRSGPQTWDFSEKSSAAAPERPPRAAAPPLRRVPSDRPVPPAPRLRGACPVGRRRGGGAGVQGLGWRWGLT